MALNSAANRRRHSMVRWTAGLGAVTAEALAHREAISLPAARGRLHAAVAAGLLIASRPLHGASTLYTVTPAGLRAVQCELDICRVRPGNARHLIACATVAAGLERCYPHHTVSGERQLRREEREHRTLLASATIGRDSDGEPLSHRPDLVLWPRFHAAGSLPLAIEVELTVKAQRRLETICLAWARCQLVAGTLYMAAPEVQRPLARAIERTCAGSRVIALPLACVPGAFADAIPSDA